MITLLLGGARSGKSAMAERLAATLPPPITYLATAVVDTADLDFARRVADHRGRRPSAWSTVEAGADLTTALGEVAGSALVDSLGTWVAAHHDFDVDLAALLGALAARTAPTVIVSEEVGSGVHPSTELGGRFRDMLGTVNRSVAEIADTVLLVVAGRGLPLERGPW